MRYFLLQIVAISLSFAGGDFFKVEPITKYEKMDKSQSSCNCGIPAKLLPYNGEDIPIIESEPCPNNACEY
jgi:hypothetical protein